MFKMKKKPKILKDIDEFVLNKIEEKTKPQAEETVDDYMPKCKKCPGAMRVVNPIIEMSIPNTTYVLEMHECESCHEREYL